MCAKHDVTELSIERYNCEATISDGSDSSFTCKVYDKEVVQLLGIECKALLDLADSDNKKVDSYKQMLYENCYTLKIRIKEQNFRGITKNQATLVSCTQN